MFKFGYKTNVLIIGLIVFILGLSFSIILFYEPTPPNREIHLPRFAMPVLTSDGEDPRLVDNSHLKLPALLNIWASWCVSCRYEHPLLMGLAQDGVRIYGLNYQDEIDDARTWLKDKGDPYVLSIVDRRGLFGAELGLYGVPETYFISAEGRIVKRHIGTLTRQAWEEKFASLWAQAQPLDASDEPN